MADAAIFGYPVPYTMKKFLILLLPIVLISCQPDMVHKSDPSLPLQSGKITMNFKNKVGLNVRSVYFLDRETGFIGNHNGELFRTLNGGKTWDLVFHHEAEHLYMQQITFTDKQTGFAVGGYTGCSGNGCTPPGGILVKTTDGGATWNVIKQQPGSYDYRGVAQNSNGDLFLLMRRPDKYPKYTCAIMRSTDLGEHWEDVAVLRMNAMKLAFDGSTGFCIGMDTSKNLIRSTNNGQTWDDAMHVGARSVDDVAFANGVSYAITDRSDVLRSTDHGTTWEAYTHSNNLSLQTINAVNDDVCLVWGSGDYSGGCFGFTAGALLETSTAGKVWIEHQFPEFGIFQHTTFFNGHHGYVVNGNVLEVVIE